MNIIVCGGRLYSDAEFVFATLDKIKSESKTAITLIHGGATGADALADIWGKRNASETIEVRADWKRHGISAGPLRNKQMLEDYRPDLVIAFPGGKGTHHMTKIANEAGVKVLEPRPIIGGGK